MTLKRGGGEKKKKKPGIASCPPLASAFPLLSRTSLALLAPDHTKGTRQNFFVFTQNNRIAFSSVTDREPDLPGCYVVIYISIYIYITPVIYIYKYR